MGRRGHVAGITSRGGRLHPTTDSSAVTADCGGSMLDTPNGEEALSTPFHKL